MKKLLTACLAGMLAITMAPVSAAAKTHYLPTKVTIYYATDGKIEKKKSQVESNEYNSKGILKKSKLTVFDKGKKLGYEKKEYKIKNNRQVSCILSNNYDGGGKSKEVYKYKNGKRIKTIYYNYDQKKHKYIKNWYETFKPASKKIVTRSYDLPKKFRYKTVDYLRKDGQIKKSELYDSKNKLLQTEKITFNKKGYIKKSYKISYDSGDKSIETFKYTYDKHNNIKTEIMSVDGEKFHKKVYEYKKFSY